MEKRLSLTIDPSNARKGASDLNRVLGDLEKKAKTITKALGDLSNVEKFAQSVGKTGEKASKASKQTDEYTLAITKAERAIQANYHSVRLLNGEVGKELELSRKMVTNKKLEFEATSKEAQAVNAATAKTKAYLKIQNDLLKTKEKLALVNTKEYRELQNLRKELDSAERSAKGLDDQSRKLQRTMMGVGIAASMFSGTMIIQDLIRTADAYTELQNKLAVVTGSTSDLVDTTDDLVKAAFNARTSLSATVDLYSKLSRVNKEYGHSQQEILSITETVSKAVAMSGASAAAAEGAVIQFAQALAGDFKTAGQELNSILEQTPGLSEALAEGLTKVGNIGEVTSSKLKKLASEGLIDTKDVMQGLLAISSDIDSKFNLSIKTVSQSLQNFSDAFTVSLGKMDQANGITKGLVETIDLLTGSLQESQAIIGGLAGLLVGGGSLAILGTVAALTSLVGLPVVLAGAGFLTLSSAIGALVAESTDARSAVNALTDSLYSLDTISGKLRQTNSGELDIFGLTDLDKKIKEDLGVIDQSLQALENMMNNPSFMQLMFGAGMEGINEQYEELIKKREALLKLQNDLNTAFVEGNLKEVGSEDKRGQEQLEEFLAILAGITDPEKAAAAKRLQQEMAEISRIAKVLGEDHVKVIEAQDAAMLRYFNRLKGGNKTLAELGDSYEKLKNSMEESIVVLGLSDREAAIFTAQLRASEAVASDYAAKIKEGTATTQEMEEAQRKAREEIAKTAAAQYDLNASLKAQSEIEASYKSLTRPVGIFGDIQDLKETKAKWKEAGEEMTAEHEALWYKSIFEGVSSGLADAIASGSTENLVQSFGNLLGSALNKSVGDSITNALTSSMGAAGAGIFGAIGGDLVGGLIGAAFQSRKTETTSTGYRLGISGGMLSEGSTSESFRKERLFRSSRRWTDYSDLSLIEFERVSNSISGVSQTIENNAKDLGISLDSFEGIVEDKSGDLSGGISKYADMYANSGLAALEKYQYLGESAADTFNRLAERAVNISEAYENIGLDFQGELVDSSILKNIEDQLKSEYQDQVETLEEELGYWQSAKETVWGDYVNTSGGKVWYGKGSKRSNLARLTKDLEEARSRLGDISDDAIEAYKELITDTVSGLYGIADTLENEGLLTGRFLELTKSFTDNYRTEAEQIQIEIDKAKKDFEDLGLSDIYSLPNGDLRNLKLTTSREDLIRLQEAFKDSPEQLVKILAAADAIAKYNDLLAEQQEIIDSDILDKASKNIDAFLLSLEASYEISIEGINNSLNSVKDSISDLEDVANSLKGIIKDSKVESEQLDRLRYQSSQNTLANLAGKYSPFNPDSQITQLQGQITGVRENLIPNIQRRLEGRAERSALKWANGIIKGYQSQIQDLESRRGDIPEIENLEEIKSALEGFYSGDTQKFFGNFEDYVRAQSATNNALNIINEATGEQLSTEEQTLKTLEEQLEATKEFYVNTQEYYKNLLDNSDNQLSILKNIAINGVGDAVIPAFADGGSHSGGLRLVGEAGAEVEYTRPSTIYTNQQSQSMLDMSGVMAEIRALRSDLRAQAAANIRNSNKVRQIMERWEGQGMPADRGF